MYNLPADDKAALKRQSDRMKTMYCLPFTIYEDKFVKGYMAFTNKTMYKLLDGKLLGTWPIIGSSDFKTEVMYGCCGFYAQVDGASTLICRFVSGRDLPRYAVIVRACEILNEQKDVATHRLQTALRSVSAPSAIARISEQRLYVLIAWIKKRYIRNSLP